MTEDRVVTVHRELAGGRATLTLDSPHNRNALSRALLAELDAALTWAFEEDEARVVVLTGAGPVFCAGADLKEAAAGGGVGDDFLNVLRQVRDAPKPTVCRLNGPVRAGGVGLMASCDIVVAPDTVTFAFTEVRLGVVPAIIAVPVMQRVAPVHARELFLSGRTFDADEAVAIGLVNDAVPTDEVEAAVATHVDALALGAPEALAWTRQVMARVPELDPDTALTKMAELSRERFGSPEAVEGIMAWREKRAPAWAPTAADD